MFLNGQDSIYYERNAFDDLTVEHNLLFNSALFWVSNNGKGGVAPKSWRFRYNVLPAITYDDKTYPSVAADCNVYIPSSSASTFLMKVTGTDGRRGFEYGTLADIQANTALDDNSIALPTAKWTDGTLFRRFVNQTLDDFDFGPVGTATALAPCGGRSGPTTLPTPGEPRVIR